MGLTASNALEDGYTTMNATRSLLLGTASLAVCLLGANVAGTEQARAATLTETLLDTGNHPTEYNTNGFGTLGFELFDSNLGTLDSVAITVTGYLNGTGSAHNITGSSQSLTYDKWSHITLTGGPGALVSALNALNGAHGLAVTTVSDTFTAAGGSITPLGPLAGSNSKSFTFNSSLAQFQAAGGGTTGLTVHTNTQDQLTETGGYFAVTVASAAQVTVAVTYTYTASEQNQVPEPGSLMLLGTALTGLGAVARRKTLRWFRRGRGAAGET